MPWLTPVSSLTYLLTSEGWCQEHNGYSHQGPGFINNLLTKRSTVTGVYLPPDADTPLATMERLPADTGRTNLAGDLAASYALRRDRLREELRRTGVAPAGITQWRWQP